MTVCTERRVLMPKHSILFEGSVEGHALGVQRELSRVLKEVLVGGRGLSHWRLTVFEVGLQRD